MNLSDLTSTLTEALSAVTGSISSYFKKKERFSQEFFIPATAFVVGCLAVLMAILGPDVPRAWWKNLTGDLKLLAVALLILALILVTELSKPLALLVRRLYSGEWPAWRWLQWPRKQSFLKDQLAWQKAPNIFAEADDIFTGLLKRFDAWQTLGKPAPKSDYPVLTRPVGAYHLIAEGDWQWASVQQTSGAITTPAGLLGHYTLRSLKPGEPVRTDDVGALPKKDYLSDTRCILPIEFFPGDLSDQVVPGSLVTLYIRPRDDPANVARFPDLFVLDRRDNRLVFSVPLAAGAPEKLVQLLPGSRLTLAFDAAADLRPLQAVPVVRATDDAGGKVVIRRGQLIQRQQIEWTVRSAEEASTLGDICTAESDIVDKLYWPAEPDGTLNGGAPFPQRALKRMPKRAQADWFMFRDANGVARSRCAQRLDLSQATPAKAPVGGATAARRSEDVKMLRVEYPAPAASRTPSKNSPPDAADAYPITAGDRVEVSFYAKDAERPFFREPLCYVHELKANEYCVLSVRDPAEFSKQVLAAQGGGAILLNPFAALPVLTEPREPGELIEAGQVTTRLFQANDSAQVGAMCLSEEEVRDCYVVADANPISAGSPIPKSTIKKALPDGQECLELEEDAGRFVVKDREGRELDGKLSALRRGDLVQVALRGPQDKEVAWEMAFVRSVGDVESELACIEIAVPSWQSDLAKGVWDSDGTIQLTLTHTDQYVQTDFAALHDQIGRQDRLAPMSKILSASGPQEHTIVQEAAALQGIVASLTRFRTQLNERPWHVTPLTDADFRTGDEAFWSLQDQLRAVVVRWQQTEQALESRRRRAMAQALPDEAAEVRPTRLGNLLAAAADYPEQIYGIDTATILPRLLNVLKPEDSEVKDSTVLRLINAEASLNMMLLFSFWAAVWAVLGGAALLAFGGARWMFPVVLGGGAFLSWATGDAACFQAQGYGEALKAIFDLRRHRLLEAISYPIAYPISPADERQHWKNLNSLFALGIADGFPKMNKPADQGKGG